MEIKKKILVLNDRRAGHLNQSIAFCKYMKLDYDIVEVRFKNRFLRLLSYLFDRVGIYTPSLFDREERFQNKFGMTEDSHSEFVSGSLYSLVVGAGSSTYYAVKVMAKKLNLKSISMMLPRGYRYNFDYIFAQSHDNPPKRENIIPIPANFAYIEPQHLYSLGKKSVGIIIGGDNSILHMSKELLKKQLDAIFDLYRSYEIAVTTSPRTAKEIEELLEGYDFAYKVIYSKEPLNPIPDFLDQCEVVCITMDSTSMISEAISYGNAAVIVLPLLVKKENKFSSLVTSLESEGYLHIFDGTIEQKNRKIDFSSFAKKVLI
ncbi:MAG: ELM1/GtrOC1 family putative glycosyltransferase [Sulfurovaceae bacterium]